MRVGLVFGAVAIGGMVHMCGRRLDRLPLDSDEGSSVVESFTHLDIHTGKPICYSISA